MATFSFDYFGSILSYLILAISIFIQQKFADKIGSELNSVISEVVFEFKQYK